MFLEGRYKRLSIYAARELVIHDYEGYKKYSCIVIDGAKAMTRNNAGSNISHLVGHVEAFEMKLRLLATCWKNNTFSYFDSLHELLAGDVEVDCSHFVKDSEAFFHDFQNRFKDFDRLTL